MSTTYFLMAGNTKVLDLDISGRDAGLFKFMQEFVEENQAKVSCQLWFVSEYGLYEQGAKVDTEATEEDLDVIYDWIEE